ncbi:hypothetical protein D9611_002387 [Ephemerocybe angulata]|uniref:Uncharacterized protein n=1 Tax=Ephemerocybe angulata TaxID=980116 RepID=A0A8H5C1S8_9AGAR|nr:hypothetical protein D9611_002387 [Tulosesus angulatus]
MAPFYPPTPPYSPLPQDESQMPEHQRTEDTLHSTKLALDSLIASYQHRQMWVCRARAALENDSPEFESYGPGTHALPPPGSSSCLDDDAYDQAEDRSSSGAGE